MGEEEDDKDVVGCSNGFKMGRGGNLEFTCKVKKNIYGTFSEIMRVARKYRSKTSYKVMFIYMYIYKQRLYVKRFFIKRKTMLAESLCF